MTELPLNTNLKRSRSARIRNAANIELHACLDEANAYIDRVQHHFQQTKFQNHVLQSAQRFYRNKSALRSASSLSSFGAKIGKRTSSSSKFFPQQPSSSIQSKIKNPEFDMVNTLDSRAYRISQINSDFREGIEEKDTLMRRMEHLKKLMVEQKNLKAKVSIRNCKLMNKAEQANYHMNALLEQSRRLQIHIRQVLDENLSLEAQLEELDKRNRSTRFRIEQEQRKVDFYSQNVGKDRRELEKQRKILQITKQRQTVRYKEMTNKYMEVNQLKQEKALLLNHIDVDLRNNL